MSTILAHAILTRMKGDIGFSGSQGGMTFKQKLRVYEILFRLYDESDSLARAFCIERLKLAKSGPSFTYYPNAFVHGDCIGADEQAYNTAKVLRYTTICCPPINPAKRAFTENDYSIEPMEYLERNKQIVYLSRLLIATPKGFKEELRSGTWSTVRFAKNYHDTRYIIIVKPDGTFEFFRNKQKIM